MNRIQVKSEQVVDAKPEDVYAVVADYKKRAQILPSNFVDYSVEKGGRGAGTVVHYRLQAAGRERPCHLNVDEPEKGRVITERDKNSSLINTWTLSPLNDGQRTKVLLTSEWDGGTGIGGFFERIFAPAGLGRIYSHKLHRLRNTVISGSPDGEEKTGRIAGFHPALVLLAVGVIAMLAIGIGVAQKRLNIDWSALNKSEPR